MTRICYVDESGCTGVLPAADSPVQPVLCVSGIIVHQPHLAHMTHEFLNLKRTFFPGQFPNNVTALSHVRIEIKGADVRTNIRTGGRNKRRHALGFLDNFLKILEKYGAKICGRVWIKGVAMPIKGRAIYDFSIQDICKTFQNLMHYEESEGFIIADSRTPYQNSGVAHSIFTQKFKSSGDSYSRLLEMPTFGHSENHVGLQMCDLLNSALISPLAIHTYCTGHITSIHVDARYELIKSRFAARLKALQYRYNVGSRMKGGITVNDQIQKRPSHLIFQ